MNNKLTVFHKLNVGDQFTDSCMEMKLFLKKESKSTAIVVDQVGYGNTRQVGGLKQFSANSIVFTI